MPNNFEPYPKNNDTTVVFRDWEYQSVKNKDEKIEINEQDILIAECDRIKKEAFEEGYAQGMQQAHTEINEKRNQLAHWLDVLKNPITLLDHQLSQEIIETIIHLSQHCIGIELTINSDKLNDLLHAIKGELPSLSTQKVLAMHPLDVDWIKKEISEKELPGLHDLLVEDPLLNRGDFYVQGEYSELDGRLSTRIATLFAQYITKDSLTVSEKVQG